MMTFKQLEELLKNCPNKVVVVSKDKNEVYSVSDVVCPSCGYTSDADIKATLTMKMLADQRKNCLTGL